MPNSSPIFLEVEDIFAIGAEQQSRRKSTAALEPTNYTNRAITSFLEAVAKMNEAVLVPSKLRDVEVRECDVTSSLPANTDLYSFFQMLNTVRQDLFSNSKYHNAFNLNAPSNNNSGPNSGRVTPTGSLSRRASTIGMYGQSTNHTINTPAISPMANGNSNGNRTLMPPNSLSFERKISNSSINGDISPDLMTSSASSNGTSLFLSPSSPVPLSFVSPSPSLNNLLANLGLDDLSTESNSEERVQQITACFTHHLTALYTILGHFTRSANYITRRYQEETEGFF